MNCPHCGTALAPRTIGGLRALGCAVCRGLWLPAAQLSSGLETLSGDPSVRAEAVAFERRSAQRPPGGASSCPVCRALMAFVNYGYDSNVFIENCLTCRAYWVEDEQMLALASFVKGEDKYAPDAAALAKMKAQETAREDRVEAFSWTATLLSGQFLPKDTSIPVNGVCWLMWSVIAANVLVFLREVRLGRRVEVFLRLFGLTRAGLRAGEYWQFLTHMFVHGGIMHLGFNMYFLWLFGRNLEDDLGRLAFIGIYLAAGLMGALFYIAAFGASDFTLIGASGAISGLLGAFYARYPGARVTVRTGLLSGGETDMPAHFFLGFWFLQQLVSAYLHRNGGGGVAFLGHVGGFVAGYLAVSPKPAGSVTLSGSAAR